MFTSPSFSWYYKEWRDDCTEALEVKNSRLLRSKVQGARCRSRSRNRRAGEGRKRLGYDESFPASSQQKEVAKADIESKTKKVPYTLVEFWTEVKMIWNFIFKWFREKNDRRKNILRNQQLWIKKCNCIMEQWRQETSKRRVQLIGKSSISIAPERNNQRKREQKVARHYVLRPGFDFTLEVCPRPSPNKPHNLTAGERIHGGPRKKGGSKSSEFRYLPPTPRQTEDIRKMNRRWQEIGKKGKPSQSQKEAVDPWCSLCLATGGNLARCSGCRRIR